MDDEAQGESWLHESEILFLDFLGFADAVESWDDAEMERLIRLLVATADAQSIFDIEGEPQNDGGYKITSRAEITTFSDHVVASYPRIGKPAQIADAPWTIIENGWDEMVRQQMQKIAAQVVMAGLGVGLLVRGGLSRGKLYHRGSVVVGEAMVDAHRLESKVARTARVVVSPRIEDDFGVFRDGDNERCLDYFSELMLLAEDRYGDAHVWAGDMLKKVTAAIKSLTARGQAHEADKWKYFAERLSRAMETWPRTASG